MSYLGRGIENLSDRVVLDSLTASATASYTLQLNSVNFVPSSAESLTVSLNGVIQAPISSYTVSGSTLTFASSLSASDSIDFIIAERGITLQTPSAGSVGTSQLASSAVTTAKITDANITNDKIANSTIEVGKVASSLKNIPAFFAHLSSNQTISTASYTKVQFDTELFDTDNAYDNSTNYRFTVPSGEAGKYFIHGQIMMTSSTDFDKVNVAIYVNGSLVSFARTSNFNQNSQSVSNIRSLSTGDYVEIYIYHQQGSNRDIEGSNQACHFYMSKLIGD